MFLRPLGGIQHEQSGAADFTNRAVFPRPGPVFARILGYRDPAWPTYESAPDDKQSLNLNYLCGGVFPSQHPLHPRITTGSWYS